MNELIEALKENNVILFVGAGVSMNLGLPSWDNLISKMAEELGYDKEIFKSFGNNLTLAEYYEIEQNTIGPLRSWMDRNWHQTEIRVEESEIHKLIVDLDFPIIYTTNFDRWLERTYQYYEKDYIKITNVGDIRKIDDDKTQIIKYHGDFDDDSSIVLTESSYFDRLDFESSLDIKLRSDVLGKSILFIGYSLSDINVRYLLYKLHKIWENSSHSNIRPESYIFLTKPNPVQEKVLEKRGIKTIVAKNDNPKESLKKFLKNLKE